MGKVTIGEKGNVTWDPELIICTSFLGVTAVQLVPFQYKICPIPVPFATAPEIVVGVQVVPFQDNTCPAVAP